MKSILAGENIPYYTHGENFTLVGKMIPVTLYVPIDSAGRAKEILKDIDNSRQ